MKCLSAMFFAASTSLLLSCGSLDEAKDSAVADGSAIGLPGVWASSCLTISDHNLKATYTFTASDLDLTISYYTDKACQLLALADEIKRSYVIGKEANGGSGIYETDYTTVSVNRTLKAADQAASYNKGTLYGYSDWTIGASKDIAGRKTEAGAESEPAKGEMIYSLIKVSGNDLSIGDATTGAGTSAANRPTSLSTSIKFTKAAGDSGTSTGTGTGSSSTSSTTTGTGTSTSTEVIVDQTNYNKSQGINIFSKKYRVDKASLFEKSCNQFFVNFWLDSTTSCLAVSASSDYTAKTITFTGQGFTKTLTTKSGAEVWIDGSTQYYCYLYTGDVYKANGERIYSASHQILTKTEASSYGDLNLSDVLFIGTTKYHCEGIK